MSQRRHNKPEITVSKGPQKSFTFTETAVVSVPPVIVIETPKASISEAPAAPGPEKPECPPCPAHEKPPPDQPILPAGNDAPPRQCVSDAPPAATAAAVAATVAATATVTATAAPPAAAPAVVAATGGAPPAGQQLVNQAQERLAFSAPDSGSGAASAARKVSSVTGEDYSQRRLAALVAFDASCREELCAKLLASTDQRVSVYRPSVLIDFHVAHPETCTGTPATMDVGRLLEISNIIKSCTSALRRMYSGSARPSALHDRLMGGSGAAYRVANTLSLSYGSLSEADRAQLGDSVAVDADGRITAATLVPGCYASECLFLQLHPAEMEAFRQASFRFKHCLLEDLNRLAGANLASVTRSLILLLSLGLAETRCPAGLLLLFCDNVVEKMALEPRFADVYARLLYSVAQDAGFQGRLLAVGLWHSEYEPKWQRYVCDQADAHRRRGQDYPDARRAEHEASTRAQFAVMKLREALKQSVAAQLFTLTPKSGALRDDPRGDDAATRAYKAELRRLYFHGLCNALCQCVIVHTKKPPLLLLQKEVQQYAEALLDYDANLRFLRHYERCTGDAAPLRACARLDLLRDEPDTPEERAAMLAEVAAGAHSKVYDMELLAQACRATRARVAGLPAGHPLSRHRDAVLAFDGAAPAPLGTALDALDAPDACAPNYDVLEGALIILRTMYPFALAAPAAHEQHTLLGFFDSPAGYAGGAQRADALRSARRAHDQRLSSADTDAAGLTYGARVTTLLQTLYADAETVANLRALFYLYSEAKQAGKVAVSEALQRVDGPSYAEHVAGLPPEEHEALARSAGFTSLNALCFRYRLWCARAFEQRFLPLLAGAAPARFKFLVMDLDQQRQGFFRGTKHCAPAEALSAAAAKAAGLARRIDALTADKRDRDRERRREAPAGRAEHGAAPPDPERRAFVSTNRFSMFGPAGAPAASAASAASDAPAAPTASRPDAEPRPRGDRGRDASPVEAHPAGAGGTGGTGGAAERPIDVSDAALEAFSLDALESGLLLALQNTYGLRVSASTGKIERFHHWADILPPLILFQLRRARGQPRRMVSLVEGVPQVLRASEASTAGSVRKAVTAVFTTHLPLYCETHAPPAGGAPDPLLRDAAHLLAAMLRRRVVLFYETMQELYLSASDRGVLRTLLVDAILVLCAGAGADADDDDDDEPNGSKLYRWVSDEYKALLGESPGLAARIPTVDDYFLTTLATMVTVHRRAAGSSEVQDALALLKAIRAEDLLGRVFLSRLQAHLRAHESLPVDTVFRGFLDDNRAVLAEHDVSGDLLQFLLSMDAATADNAPLLACLRTVKDVYGARLSFRAVASVVLAQWGVRCNENDALVGLWRCTVAAGLCSVAEVAQWVDGLSGMFAQGRAVKGNAKLLEWLQSS